MQSAIQIASEAARQMQTAQSLVSHNLANASTTAFKADLYQAQSQYLRGGAIEASATTSSLEQGVDWSPGNIQPTGRDLDIAINGEGWMRVIGPDGTESLSRRGDLRVDTTGQLLDGAGNMVMGNGGPIALPPYSSMTIGSDGTISIVPLGEPPTAIVALERIMLVNPPVADLRKGLDGQVRVEDMAGLEPDASVRIAVGSLEGSNVNPITAMVQMIQLSRSFEAHTQAMKTANELDTSSSSLMKLE
jgi:flagellar basal-body rod protein FlgF